jgi:hypothetical protein
MPRLTKDKRLQEIKPSRNNYDCMPANATVYERRKLMREQIKKGRKSPDVAKMHSIEVVGLKITYYCKNVEARKKKVSELNILYPERELIIKNPVK